MPRRPAASDKDGAAVPALQAKEQMEKLKKKREQEIFTASVKSKTALDDLRHRIAKTVEEERRSGEKHRTGPITGLVQAKEREREILTKVADVVTAAHAEMQKVEEIMKAGYAGREAELETLRRDSYLFTHRRED
ncbi:hypothetical protein S40288_10852 [Stachybotrys chartarum IBT 40288]|nr:hypothetical protein S40288_10852 [Stachybotrys chartarum IBT 40288]